MLPGAAQAAVRYISPTGNDSTGDGSTGTPYKTLTKLKAVGACGDTWILKDGVYNYAGMEFDGTNIPACSSWSSSITIRAENIFKATVTLSNALNMGCDDGSATNWYSVVQGINFDYNSTKRVCGNYWKFQNCAFMGGGTSNYEEVLAIGTNNYGSNPGATYGLVEDSHVIGDGGRYGIMIFNSRYVLGRRNVVWMDDTYATANGNPAACFNIYNSEYSWFQNSVCMDIEELPDYFQAAFYYTANTNDIPLTGNYSGYAGSLAVNVKEYCSRFDGALNISSATLDNVSCIDTTDGISLGAGSQSRTVTVRNSSIVSVSTLTTGNEIIGIAEYDAGGTKSIINSVIANWQNDSISGSITGTYIDCYNNGGTCDGGTGQTTVNPRTSGMKYFTRIENGSTLKTAGSGGGQIGAEIQYKIGTTGTLYGDSGWDTLTADSLWPWTNESYIKGHLCSHYSSYGLCSTKYSSYTLTEYLNGYGNSPSEYYAADTSSPTAPGTPMVTSTGTTTLDISWSASTDDVGVSAYEIDVSTDNFSTYSAGYNDFDMGSGTTEQLTGLSAATQYYFRLRAKDEAGNTSSSSTAGTGTTNAEAAPSSAIRGVSVGAGRRITVGPGRSVKF